MPACGGAGKTSTASALSRHYDIPVLTIDDVIMTSLSTSSAHGARARELCAEAARRLSDESIAGDERGPISVDALSTHTLSIAA